MSDELVTIVVSAGGATEKMLRTCLDALGRHQGCTASKVVVVVPNYQGDHKLEKLSYAKGAAFWRFDVSKDHLSGSRVHAAVLDQAVPHVDTPYLLTLDADCFPVADDWLDALMAPIGGGASVTGILHPYIPPPPSMSVTSVEYRIRSQLCERNTHVACQLVGVKTLTNRLQVGFSDGDDTGLAIPTKAREMGMKVCGLKLSGCAFPSDAHPMLDSNREFCLLFGDKVYHHGGGCREEQDKGTPASMWERVREKVLRWGAEFLLEEGNAYRYSFENEEEVADEMVKGITRGMQIYLETHDRVFED